MQIGIRPRTLAWWHAVTLLGDDASDHVSVDCDVNAEYASGVSDDVVKWCFSMLDTLDASPTGCANGRIACRTVPPHSQSADCCSGCATSSSHRMVDSLR